MQDQLSEYLRVFVISAAIVGFLFIVYTAHRDFRNTQKELGCKHRHQPLEGE